MSIWPGKGMISLREFGAYADCSVKVVKGMISRGELRAVHLGREWRIPRAEAFRALGLEDPEGQPPRPVVSVPRRKLPPEIERVVQRHLAH